MRTAITYASFIFLLTLLQSCGNNTTDKEFGKTIVLVNYKTVDRSAIANGIRLINKCKPKIIGINAVFIGSKDAIGDTLLAQAIRANKNVVLASNGNFERRLTTGDSLISSNSIFTRSCLADGLIHFGYKNDVVSSHIPYRSVGEQLVWSYPITIASYFNMELASKFMNDFLGDTYYEIVFGKNMDDFKILEIDKLDQLKCEDLEGKIVLLGYLGPGNEDLFDTASSDNEKMYGTVITANIILNLLNGGSIKQEDEVQDREEKLPPTIAIKHVL